MAGYVVTAGGLVAKVSSETGEGYFYRGDILPAGVPAAEVKRLAEMGLVEELKLAPVPLPPVAGTGVGVPTAKK